MKSIFILSLLFVISFIPEVKAFTTPQVNAGNIYVFESDANAFNTNTIFYDNGQEVVAFDAQFTEQAAQQAINFLRTKTQNPIKWLVVSHPNPDKFNGTAVFQKNGAKVIMSKETVQNLQGVHAYKKHYFVNVAKSFTAETFPNIPAPDVTFQDTYTIKLQNGDEVQLKELHKDGISNNQTVAFLPKLNSLIVGDLVHYKVHAWLEGPIVNGNSNLNIQNWISVLQSIKKMYKPDVLVYGGRGGSGKLTTVIDEQINYLTKANQLTKEYLQSLEGNTLTEKKKKVDYNLLTKQFENQFSGYTLPYMITYGSYGLVQSIK